MIIKVLSSALLIAPAFSLAQNNARQEWLQYMDKVARPVLSSIAEDQLKEKMPVELSEKVDHPEMRKEGACNEAFARTLSGIAPWINIEGGTEEEIRLRNEYRQWALRGIINSVDPEKKDHLVWTNQQQLVEASFFALALIRSPWLWENLGNDVQQKVILALQQSRPTVPYYNNWILFSSMVEAFFCKYDIPYDPIRIEYGLNEFFEHWYVGDGLFSDGPHFAMDNYNSYVIQPYLLNIIEATSRSDRNWNRFLPRLEKIAARYAEIQERAINSDGSFPVIGRSIVYRGGAFQHLADMALKKRLPPSLNPGQVRAALYAVIQKTLDAPETFTDDGWLRPGLCGHQPELADFYISTGSLYLCSTIFLPLGLPPEDPFWTDPSEPWTSKKVWSGIDMPSDHSYHE